jgi:peptidyl-dipeptidase Dcp
MRLPAALLLTACVLAIDPGASQAAGAANPFAQASTLPYQAPDFSRIHDSDYEPAFMEGMKQQRAEMDAIAANPDAPTFDNTIVAMEKSGRMLDRVSQTFFDVRAANTNDALDKVQSRVAPLLAAHNDAIVLDPRLFARVKALYDRRDTLHLDAEAAQVLKLYYNQFVHAGANLDDAGKQRLQEIDKEEASLRSTLQQKLIAASKAGALVVTDKADLAGLSEAGIASAAAAAKARGLDGKWVIPLQSTTQQPALTDLSDRATRQRLFDASSTRTEKGDANDTRATIAQLAVIRAEKARLLG